MKNTMRNNATAVLMLGLTVWTLGCVKQPEMKPDFGPEVNPEKILQALDEALTDTPSPHSIQKDEYVYSTRETWIDGRPYSVDERWALTVTDKVDKGDHYQLSFALEIRRTENGEEKISAKAMDARLKKTPTARSGPAAPEVTYDESSILQALKQKTSDIQPNLSPFSFMQMKSIRALANRFTFHNFKFENGRYPIPDFVRQRKNCGGYTPEKCQDSLKAFYIAYDQVEWLDSGTKRISVSEVYSPEVPFFASVMTPLLLEVDEKSQKAFRNSLLRLCAKINIPVGGQQVQVTQCNEIKDFTYGQASSQ